MPTTSISLIREHTVRIRPPRALWVPFELGRPLGVPGDAAFQQDVVLAALRLLSANQGPVLKDYGIEAPSAPRSSEGWACPLNLQRPTVTSEHEQLATAFSDELAQMRVWYDLAVERRGHTSVGASGLPVERLADPVSSLLREELPDTIDGVPVTRYVNLVADDIRGLYMEALTVQPGQQQTPSEILMNWFYMDTAAGRALFAIRQRGKQSGDTDYGEAARSLAVPARLAHRG